MSRIAKKPIILPAKTEASFGAGVMTVKGPLGEIRRNVRDDVTISVEGNAVTFTPAADTIRSRELWGTYAAQLRTMIAGVNKAFERKLVIEGIGYKADVKGKDIVLSVGFSHQISIPIPSDLKVTTEKNTITVSGIDKEKVGQFAAVLRATKKPEPYLGKGIKYADEVIRRKQGKKAA